jgi:tyrosinase
MIMTTSRRTVLLRGAAIGAGVISARLTGIEAFAQGQPPQRRSLEGLAWNDPIVATYRDAVRILKAKLPSEKVSWAGLAGIHGSTPGAYHFCPHGNWYFLPWHRAYLLTYERIIRDLTSHTDFAFPFWDWTANPTMPEVFLSPTTPDGKPNALFVDDQDFGNTWKRTWPANEPMPANIVGPAVLQQILEAPDYESFGTSRPRGQNNRDPSWVLKRTGVQGTLEARPHNQVHNNIGGWMPSALSPRDPIFFMHHCNIDRIWALWNSLGGLNSHDALWTDMVFTNNFINPNASPYSPKVSDLFHPEDLGYTYGLSPAPGLVVAASSAITALQENLLELRTATGPINTAAVRTFAASPPAGVSGGPKEPLAVSVGVDPSLIATVAKRNPVPSGNELLSFSAARERRATGPHILAFVRDVAVTRAQDSEYLVLIDHPGLMPNVTDRGFVGSFGVFVHDDQGGHNMDDPSFAFDLTDTIRRLYGAGEAVPERITLAFASTSAKPNATAGQVRPDRVEIAFLNG